MKLQGTKLVVTGLLAAVLLSPGYLGAQGGGGEGGGGGGGGDLKPLKSEAIPLPSNLGDFVADQAAAIQLGKALFWDRSAGGDGQQACASCHFQSGSDVRTRNQISPGANGAFDTMGTDKTLTMASFPVTTGDVIGSQGEIKRQFTKLGSTADKCKTLPDAVYNVHGSNVRQVTGRNAPSAVNAIFNFRSFWDGRANNVFNGASPFGPNDPNATVLQVTTSGPVPVIVRIPNASLASQAVGPPNNKVEMSCDGRTFPLLGRKMLGLKPLAQQLVSPTDSVLGPLADKKKGLKTTYAAMIQAAFKPEWWNSATKVGGFSVMESNFSLYWGLSIMLYESTLVSDDSRVDRYLAGDRTQLTPVEQLGLDVFTGKGRCDKCHSGAVTTEATVANTLANGGDPETGFINSAVRPASEDAGDIIGGNGFFKTPSVRNTELTGPYFHNGDKATLREVVDFYDRGGDFPSALTDGDVRPLGLTEAEKQALVAFMVAYTDDRVRYERAPFDHPALAVPNGPSVPAVGAAGRSSAVTPFLNASPNAQ